MTVLPVLPLRIMTAQWVWVEGGDGVVDDGIAGGGRRRVLLEQGNAGTLIAVDQVVLDQRVLNAVGVDAGAAAGGVAVDAVVFDNRASDNPAAALADIAVDHDPAAGVVEDCIAGDRRADGRVGDVDPVLQVGGGNAVAGDEGIVREAGGDAPGAGPDHGVAGDGHIGVANGADAGGAMVPSALVIVKPWTLT